jgi:hypothetical protein
LWRRVERLQTRGDVEDILGSGLRGQRGLEGNFEAQKTPEDEEWSAALGSQRPGGHKLHLEAAEERRPVGRKVREERTEYGSRRKLSGQHKERKKRQLQE